MKRSYLITLFAALPLTAQAQLFTFGVKGGAPAETPLGQTDDRMPFVLGPAVNVRISSRISLESGILFYRMGQTSNPGVFPFPQNGVTLLSRTERGRAVELPFMAKYHFTGEQRTWRPFITAGPAVRRTSLDARSSSVVLSGASSGVFPQSPVLDVHTVKWNVDPAAGVGVSFKSGRFRFEPEVRYSYWGAGSNSAVRKNQVHVLFGLRF